MKFCWLILWVLTLLGITAKANAQHYFFYYSDLHHKVRFNEVNRYPDVKVGLFFINQADESLCTITDAWMSKEDKVMPLTSSLDQGLILPSRVVFHSINPHVFVDTQIDSYCQYKPLMIVRYPKGGRISTRYLLSIVSEMSQMRKEVFGPINFSLEPSISGLDFLWYTQTEMNTTEYHHRTITISELTQQQWVDVPQEVSVIRALM